MHSSGSGSDARWKVGSAHVLELITQRADNSSSAFSIVGRLSKICLRGCGVECEAEATERLFESHHKIRLALIHPLLSASTQSKS
jgi:hypothetical protein